MTLIDIDPLKERIDKDVKEDKVLDGWAFFIKAYLDSEPHIDIVQCKECKWAEPNKEGDYNCKCHIPRFRVSADDFCSYGERKANGQIHRRR